MADQLATPEDLAALLQMDLDLATATVVIEAATAVVQEAAGRPPQRLVLVENDEATLLGTTDSWLDLPQRPVTDVTSVTLDGGLITDHTRFGSRLWRSCGWAASACAPSTVQVVYSHGYPPGHQVLQLARSAVLSLARVTYANPTGQTSERLDDYAVAYAAVAAAMEASPHLRAGIRRQYGRGAGLVRIG